MAQVRSDKKKFKRVVALDGHRLGLVSGTVLAAMVMAACFYVQYTDPLTAVVRAGWAFVAGYGAVFFLIRMILRTTLFEFVQQQDPRRKKKALRLGRGERQEAELPLGSTAGLGEGLAEEIPPEVLSELGVEHLGDTGVERATEEELAALGDSGIERLGMAQVEQLPDENEEPAAPISEGLVEEE